MSYLLHDGRWFGMELTIDSRDAGMAVQRIPTASVVVCYEFG